MFNICIGYINKLNGSIISCIVIITFICICVCNNTISEYINYNVNNVQLFSSDYCLL